MSVSPYITPGLQITPEIVIQQVCKAYGIERGIVFVFYRKRRIVECRYMIYLLLRRFSGKTLKGIGAIAHRDHSSIISGIRRIKSLSMTDHETYDRLKSVCESLGFGEWIIKEWQKEHTT